MAWPILSRMVYVSWHRKFLAAQDVSVRYLEEGERREMTLRLATFYTDCFSGVVMVAAITLVRTLLAYTEHVIGRGNSAV